MTTKRAAEVKQKIYHRLYSRSIEFTIASNENKTEITWTASIPRRYGERIKQVILSNITSNLRENCTLFEVTGRGPHGSQSVCLSEFGFMPLLCRSPQSALTKFKINNGPSVHPDHENLNLEQLFFEHTESMWESITEKEWPTEIKIVAPASCGELPLTLVITYMTEF